MPVFTLLSLASVDTALSALTHVHGAYRAVDLLLKSLDDVEESATFDEEVKRVEAAVGASYQGPEKAGRAALKAIKTAANAVPSEQEPLLELVKLVVLRLGASQGSRVLVLLLAAAGLDPTLSAVVIKLCLMLARSESGRKIVAGAKPKLLQLLAAASEKTPGVGDLKELLVQIDDRGRLLDAVQRTPATLTQAAATTSKAALDSGKDALAAGKDAWDQALDAIVWPMDTKDKGKD